MTARWIELGDPAWNEALAGLDHDVYHLAEWTEAEAGLVGGTGRAFSYQDGSAMVFLPLVFRPIPGTDLVDATSTFGYPGPLTNVEDADTVQTALGSLHRALLDAGAVSAFVRGHPLVGVGAEPLEPWGTVVQHGETVAIDVQQTEEEIWRWVKRDHRSDINRARREDMTARIDHDWDRVDDFLTVYRETMDRVHAAGTYFFPREYFLDLKERLGSRVQLWLVETGDGEVASAGLFTQVDGIVQFHLSGTADAHLRFSPSKLMIAEVWRSARELGQRVFHLGGGVGASDDSLFTFKSRFSNWRLPFHTWRVIVRPETYEELTNGESADDDFFPAYRRTLGAGEDVKEA
ncbi:MAG: GNAT family N-acetyltransferase [Acidimicrobiia bacterium]|nr:GNAT family N-acetyltransferase [Acidimicrobiia bacterium]